MKTMTTKKIDPYNITKYDRTEEELQLFLLFCIVVAGKTAYIQAEKLEQFLCSPATVKDTPELTIFPTKLLETPLDTVSIPYERVQWMASHFGFTAMRDPTI